MPVSRSYLKGQVLLWHRSSAGLSQDDITKKNSQEMLRPVCLVVQVMTGSPYRKTSLLVT